MVKTLESLLEQSRIIPAVRDSGTLAEGDGGSRARLFICCVERRRTSAKWLAQVSACGKVPIVNLDLVSGFARDAAAIEFMSHRGIRGIISTHQVPLRAARSLGLFAIQRTFLLDSAALQSSLRSDRANPSRRRRGAACDRGSVSGARVESSKTRSVPVIAGGLVQSLRQIQDLIDQGVNSVSVGNPDYWLV